MITLFLACDARVPAGLPPTVTVTQLAAVPTQRDLRFLHDVAVAQLPEDPTPSLEEIAARPDVPHQGEPQKAPQQPDQPVRVIVAGSDAALSAVLTRLMRADHLWFEVAYLPVDPGSSVAALWNLPRDPERALDIALRSQVNPVPLIRDDAGTAVAGSATVTASAGGEITGEVIVDDTTLIRYEARKKKRWLFSRAPRTGVFGARLVPTVGAPGLAAGVIVAAEGQVAPESVVTGRALQAGGVELAVAIDGVVRPRPVKAVTFYRHLRDVQAVRL